MLIRREVPGDAAGIRVVHTAAFATAGEPMEVRLVDALREVAAVGLGPLGEPLIALLGSPGYYGRFGFVAGSRRSINPPEASRGGHFQVRTLTDFDASITGTFAYASPFSTVT
jgi:predicted N-acetyltransferase YhbS